MNDVTIKNRIEAAVGVQKAPEKLVQQTILRVQGVTAGRNAEQRLEQEGSHLPQKEIAYLTAAGLIGRLAFFCPLPEGCSLQQMTEQLASSPKLLQRLNRPVHETLSHLRSGMLFSEIGAQPPHRETLHTKAPKAVEPPTR